MSESDVPLPGFTNRARDLVGFKRLIRLVVLEGPLQVLLEMGCHDPDNENDGTEDKDAKCGDKADMLEKAR